MKNQLKYIALAFLASAPSILLADKCCKGGKTFLRPRSIIEDVSLSYALTDYMKYHQYYEGDGEQASASSFFNVTGFYQKSIHHNGARDKRKNHDETARYFLPGAQRSISIREDGTGDVDSLWLGVIAPTGQSYASRLSLCPERSVAGAIFQYNQVLGCGLWFDARFAFGKVRQGVRAHERLANNAALGTLPGATTALEVLGGPSIQYDKIESGKHHHTLADDLFLRLGYNVMGGQGYHMDIYGSVLVPTSKRRHDKFLFEPTLGRGKHTGVGVGLNAGFELCNNFVYLTDFSYEYLFKKEEHRSVDLVNGQWSRFLRLSTPAQPGVSIPAINVLTTKFKVKPRGTINWWNALHYNACSFHAEVGYNLWWRQREKVCFGKCKKQYANLLNQYGILDLAGLASSSCALTSASHATISQGAVGPNAATSDAAYTTLTLADINLDSARQSRMLTNKVYAALGYDTKGFCGCPIDFGVGASYEIARRCDTLQQWGVWGQITLGF